MAHQCTTCQHQVRTGRIKTLIDEEILLFPTEVYLYLVHIVVEILANIGGRLIDGVEGTQQRSLVVEGLACVGDEDGGDTEGVVDDEDGRCGIPGGIASCLEGVADTARGERTGIGLLLYEQFTAEVLHHTSLTVMFDEGIVFLCRTLSEGLEPVRVMGSTHLLSPLFHACCHSIGYRTVQTGPVVDDVDEFGIDIRRQVFIHLLTIEHVFAEILGRSFLGCFHLYGLFLEGLFYDLKS